jgi:hypothetical protein
MVVYLGPLGATYWCKLIMKCFMGCQFLLFNLKKINQRICLISNKDNLLITMKMTPIFYILP